jgi:hypothetical protein
MTEGLAALVRDAVWSMREDDDGGAVASIVRLQLGAPAEVVELLADELMAALRTGGSAPALGPRDPAGRLPDDDAVAALLAAVASGDSASLSVLAGDSYVGLLVVLIGTLARLSPASGPAADESARPAGPQESDDFCLVSVPVADITLPDGATTSDPILQEQIEWGLDVLARIVGPAVRMGKGTEYFADRDRSEGCSAERSYVRVHRWFYAPDEAIRLVRTDDGRLEVLGGCDRVAVARLLGVDELPAFVR